MTTNSNFRNAETGSATRLSVDQITRLADTISACERLCLLSVRTILRSAVPLRRPGEARTFLPSLSRDLFELGGDVVPWPGSPELIPWYPTTSAHCIAALQALLPAVGRFRLTTLQSKDLAFHPIERDALEDFDPKRIPEEIRKTIEDGLKAFTKRGFEQIWSAAGSGLPPLDDHQLVDMFLHSTTFGTMHPFTAAQVLRATAPSAGLFGQAWWRSLFISLWFLNRRGSSPRGYPNTQATASPGTAYLTHKCIAAVEAAYSVLDRRWKRFRQLTKLTRELIDVQNRCRAVKKLNKQIDTTEFTYGYKYQEKTLIHDIRATLEEIAKDTGLEIYQKWYDSVSQSEDDKFLSALVAGFADAVRAATTALDVKKIVGENNAPIERIGEIVASIHDRLLPREQRKGRTAAPNPDDWKKLPPWACSRNYQGATASMLEGKWPESEPAERLSASLRTHWRRHHDATTAAAATMRAVSDYFTGIMKCFTDLSRLPSGKARIPSAHAFLKKLDEASEKIPQLHRQMRTAIDTGARWGEILMNRHLGYAESGSATLFDPGELAHALCVVCRDRRRPRYNTVLAGLRAICVAQLEDGTWPCRQPIYWTDTGQSVPTISVETALAVVSTVAELVRNPEDFGASAQEIAVGLQPVYAALDRFFGWLSGSVQNVPVPLAFGSVGPKDTPLLYGWCSDRVFEPGRIQSWVTAYAVEFLIEFRGLLQERINATLRSEFRSHHSTELTPLSRLSPTDLGKLASKERKAPVVGDLLLTHLRDHKALQFAEGPWLPEKPQRPPISFYSAILYGPPGSSKTFLAKSIAGELQWPLISLSPADFLAGGQDQVESHAREIFTVLAAGNRLIYFFDEMDELMRDRDQLTNRERSVFSFLTPSFLTKLQDLRDDAKENEFIFILGTNYLDNIDSAAKRSGRIDEQLPVVYPDSQARANILIYEILKKTADIRSTVGVSKIQRCLDILNTTTARLVSSRDDVKLLDVVAEFSGFLSYPKLDQLAGRVRNMVVVITEEQVSGEDMDRLIRTLSDQDAIKARQALREARPKAELIAGVIGLALSQLLRDLYYLQTADDRARFKSELRLDEYAGRPEAVEEIRLVAEVIPAKPFPWKWDEADHSWQPSTAPSRRVTELDKLLESVKKKLTDQHDGADLKPFKEAIERLLAEAKASAAGPRRKAAPKKTPATSAAAPIPAPPAPPPAGARSSPAIH